MSEGSGIGLSIVKRIIESHKGKFGMKVLTMALLFILRSIWTHLRKMCNISGPFVTIKQI